MTKVKINIGGQTIEVGKEAIDNALTNGEVVNVEGLNLKVFSNDDYNTLISNVEKEGYNKGKVSGEQMAVKSVRDTYGLDFEGKTVANFAEAFKQKLEQDLKVEPDTKIEELKKDNDLLRNNLTEFENKFNNLQSSVEQEKKDFKATSLILNSMPASGLSVKPEIATKLFKMEYSLDFDESGEAIVKKGDTVIKDETTRSPIKINSAIESFLQTEGLIAKPDGSGRGADDETGSGNVGDIKSFIKEMEDNGKNMNDIDVQEEMNKRIADGTLKV